MSERPEAQANDTARRRSAASFASASSAPLTSVLLAGGGTAGHVSPLLATADALRRRHPDVRITVLGSHGGLEETLVPERGYELRLIDKAAFPRRPNADAVRFLAQATYGPTDDLITQVRQQGYEAWLTNQFNTGQTRQVDILVAAG